jgi:aspartyl-tRNA(Asn)/glutamyl-tRNA(Gln) amidotransferase subunit A
VAADLPRLTIAQLREAYRLGHTTPSAVAQGCLARAGEPQARGVFITLTPERAMREARAADARWRAGRPLSALDGIPVSWKDLFDVAGTVTTAGSQRAGSPPAARDAAAVQRLSARGAVCIGKTNLSELAFSGLGLNPWHGTPRNPHGPPHAHHVCGGSSSGAAASVALGLCAVAIGTDTSGSVRVPAAFTGLAGWKPGRTAWPLDGVRPLAPSLDALGVIAPTAEDAAQVHAAFAGTPDGPAQVPCAPRIVADEQLFTASDEAPRANGLAALRAFERQGLPVELRRVPEFDAVRECFERHGTLVAAEAVRQHRALLDGPGAHRIDPLVRQRLEAARAITDAQYAALKTAQRDLMQALGQHWPEGTVFAFPTSPITAPAVSGLARPEAYARVNARALSHTMVGSFLDLPGMALPTGRDAQGLPTSLLLSGLPGSEAALLALCLRAAA